jgi:tetratricopeptide (TPR) repeat protein
MQQWIMFTNRGKTFLARHNPKDAAYCFEKALQACPAKDMQAMGDIFYLCGVALNKLGYHDNARECWFSASSINPKGPAGGMLKRQAGQDEADWHTFKSIQLYRYFSSKKADLFYSETERKNVMRIIDAYWQEIKAAGILEDMGSQEKRMLFFEFQINFAALFTP